MSARQRISDASASARTCFTDATGRSALCPTPAPSITHGFRVMGSSSTAVVRIVRRSRQQFATVLGPVVPPEIPDTRLLETSGSKGHFFHPGTAFRDGNREGLPLPPGDEGACVTIA